MFGHYLFHCNDQHAILKFFPADELFESLNQIRKVVLLYPAEIAEKFFHHILIHQYQFEEEEN